MAATPSLKLTASPRRRFGRMFRDFRHAARALAKSPGFALVAIDSLALGIGANSAIFSLADAPCFGPCRCRTPPN